MAPKIVLDTSVLIKWIKTKDEQLLEEARRLLHQVEAKPLDVHVPALLLYEIGNILLLKTDLDAGSLDHAIEGLEALPFIVAPAPWQTGETCCQIHRESCCPCCKRAGATAPSAPDGNGCAEGKKRASQAQNYLP